MHLLILIFLLQKVQIPSFMHLLIHFLMHLFIFIHSLIHASMDLCSESDARPSSSSDDMLPVTPAMTPRPQRQVSLPSRSSPSCRLLPLWQRLFHLRRSAGWIKRNPRLVHLSEFVVMSYEFVIRVSSEPLIHMSCESLIHTVQDGIV